MNDQSQNSIPVDGPSEDHFIDPGYKRLALIKESCDRLTTYFKRIDSDEIRPLKEAVCPQAVSIPLYGWFRLDLMLYCMYLAQADTTVDLHELHTINTLLETDYSAEDVRNMVAPYGDLTDFSDKVPSSLLLAVQTDAILREADPNAGQAAPLILDLYEKLGFYLMSLDRVMTAREMTVINTYLDNMQKSI